MLTYKNVKTRKSSSVNARGTPPAAYQVLAVLLPNPDLVGGGVPRPRWGGTPSQVRGVPNPKSGGYPIQNWSGGTPSQVWEGTPSRPGTGYPLPLPRPGMGYPLYLNLGWGTPYLDLRWGTPPPRNGGQSENITFRHPSDAGGNYSRLNVPAALKFYNGSFSAEILQWFFHTSDFYFASDFNSNWAA